MPSGSLAATEPAADTASVTVEAQPIRIWAVPEENRTVTVREEPRVVPVR